MSEAGIHARRLGRSRTAAGTLLPLLVPSAPQRTWPWSCRPPCGDTAPSRPCSWRGLSSAEGRPCPDTEFRTGGAKRLAEQYFSTMRTLCVPQSSCYLKWLRHRPSFACLQIVSKWRGLRGSGRPSERPESLLSASASSAADAAAGIARGRALVTHGERVSMARTPWNRRKSH